MVNTNHRRRNRGGQGGAMLPPPQPSVTDYGGPESPKIQPLQQIIQRKQKKK